jgi:hypothetical protein
MDAALADGSEICKHCSSPDGVSLDRSAGRAAETSRKSELLNERGLVDKQAAPLSSSENSAFSGENFVMNVLCINDDQHQRQLTAGSATGRP